MRRHDFLNDREAQARAVSGGIAGLERLKQLVLGFVRNARAVVMD